ncbi:uncharacterized protein [Oscarella lobularis]|uniref:uncharacterized protein isoform X2 n=1 Tax=Oscarella lobularis TaxID=121494 RepID=UPI0033131537
MIFMNLNLKRDVKKRLGMWLDLELHGTRPKPLVLAAMATIDHHQALLHGRDLNLESHSFVMNLNNKTWTIVDFNVKPSPREGHRICQLVKQGLEDKSICLLIGGRMFNETNSDYVYVLDCEKSKSYQIDVDPPQLGKVWQHTCHCVQNKDKTTEVFVCGGRDWDLKFNPIISFFHLDFEKESNMIMEQEILLSRQVSLCAAISSPRLPLPSGSEEIDMMQRELEHLRRRCVELDEEKRANSALFDEEIASIREELVSAQRLVQRKDGEIAQIRQQLASLKRVALVAQRRLEQRKDEQIASIRKELTSAASTAQRRHREELEISLTRCETLEASRDEIKERLDEFTDVLNIKSDEVHLTDKKLGTGSFAGVSVGQWRGMTVAVKKIHDLITSQRNVAMFRREVLVCSRLHHPNIMIVCGAVMAEGAPLQIVMELLEGSVGEVIDAAHASGSYLTTYEQLSIAIDMTSGISYLHQIRPRPYVHGDIRPSNVLVARDMKVKVGDLGAAHLIESSLSAGPMSPPYLAPERTLHSGGSGTISTLSSDVYSMGVSLIEIFTGVGPIPEERKTQLDALAVRLNLFMLCSRLIGRNPANRISAQRCFETLKINFAEHERRLSAQEIITAKRLVKGVFEGDTHKVVLLNISIN